MKLIVGAYYEYVSLHTELCVVKVIRNDPERMLYVCVYNYSRNGTRLGDFWPSHLKGKGKLLNTDKLMAKHRDVITIIEERIKVSRKY